MTQTAEQVAAGLTEAQRDIMLGHLVEISPEEGQQLIDLGLKLKPFSQREVITRTVWPITEKGRAVRTILQEKTDA